MSDSRWWQAQYEIGRTVVAFSYLVYGMRREIETRLEDEPKLSSLALGEATASQIANAFFAICEDVADLDDEETQVAIRLKNEVNDAIRERNDFAHGDWFHQTGPEGVRGFRLQRTKPGRKAGPFVSEMRLPDDLEKVATDLEELTDYVAEFGQLCLSNHVLTWYWERDVRVRDIFRFRNRQVLRIGRYADRSKWGP